MAQYIRKPWLRGDRHCRSPDETDDEDASIRSGSALSTADDRYQGSGGLRNLCTLDIVL